LAEALLEQRIIFKKRFYQMLKYLTPTLWREDIIATILEQSTWTTKHLATLVALKNCAHSLLSIHGMGACIYPIR
jgi:hypothetical protein